MKIQHLIISASIVLFIAAILTIKAATAVKTAESFPQGMAITKNSPPCLQLCYYLEKYSIEYRIPKNYAYGIAHEETGYNGPFHWEYNHAQGSSAGALGPMQIMPATARWIWPDSTFTNKRLKNDIEFNVRTSMKLLRHLHDKYDDWKTVFGCYNTGKKLVNKYALRVYNFKFESPKNEYTNNSK